jgi:Domain of unknown function (DUF222)
MRSIGAPDEDEINDVLDRLRAAAAEVAALPVDAISAREQLAVLDATERIRRQLPVVEHRAINALLQQATPAEIGGPLHQVLADRLHITSAEARRRIGDAECLGPHTSMTGESLAPRWPATAAAQRDGAIGVEHVREIGRFFNQLPCSVDEPTREQAETDLAAIAARVRPDELRQAAERIAAHLNPDGNFSDQDRARKRGLSIGRQDIDGMSPISGYLTPEARASLDAVLAKWAAPGMCNPDDQTPTIDGAPSEEAIRADRRTRAQRNHDALNAGCEISHRSPGPLPDTSGGRGAGNPPRAQPARDDNRHGDAVMSTRR